MYNKRIVIYGLSKSGSTGLYFKIKNSLSSDCYCLFEPSDQTDLPDLSNIKASILVKKIFLNDNFADLYTGFDKRVILTRDPRDRAISQLLYRTGYHILPETRENMSKHIEDSLKLLKSKEANPQSISFIEISRKLFNENQTQVVGRIQEQLDALIRFREKNMDCFIFKYEDFITQNFTGLENYLELPLTGTSKVAEKFSRVVRTKSSGSWKDWLLKEDLPILQPVMKAYFQCFDYDFTDWELNPTQSIPPEHCSLYVKKILNERLEALGKELYIKS